MSIASNQRGSRNEWDFYPTPPHHTRAIMPYIPMGSNVWECAAGDGSMTDVLAKRFNVYSSDIHPQRADIKPLDFLSIRKARSLVDAVVTNPPFKLSTQFVHHAIYLHIPFIAMLMPVHYLGGQARRKELFEPHPPDLVVVVSKRMPQSQFNHAWYVWQPDLEPRRRIEWV